jgi:hypothetical protein
VTKQNGPQPSHGSAHPAERFSLSAQRPFSSPVAVSDEAEILAGAFLAGFGSPRTRAD